ncbi:hypothetical protein GCM10010387_20470 [Streptomyces inusitatus]|uniref:Uncharacterized protein n=1 Tax=Streptomyces inusitatus TaxID=68221 RepID=A0A918PYC7_9ACTN|nr:hypothetical protein GCM10010387_20470 [Streptomyces inusitatus]
MERAVAAAGQRRGAAAEDLALVVGEHCADALGAQIDPHPHGVSRGSSRPGLFRCVLIFRREKPVRGGLTASGPGSKLCCDAKGPLGSGGVTVPEPAVRAVRPSVPGGDYDPLAVWRAAGGRPRTGPGPG